MKNLFAVFCISVLFLEMTSIVDSFAQSPSGNEVKSFSSKNIKQIQHRLAKKSEEAENLSFIGSWRPDSWHENPSYAVDIQDSVICTANYNILEIGVLRSPAYPVFISSVNYSERINDIEIRGDNVYISVGEYGFRVIDISDISNPVEIADFKIPGKARGIFIKDNYAFIAYDTSGLRILDISSPGNPSPVGTLPSNDISMDVTVSGNYAYLSDHQGGIRIIDITDPSTPEEVNSMGEGEFVAYSSEVKGDYVYVVDWIGYIQVIRISDLNNLVRNIRLEVGSHPKGLMISGDMISLYGDGGLQVIDISTPYLPELLDSRYAAPLYGICINEDFAYLASGNFGTVLYYYADPGGSSVASSSIRALDVTGNYAFVAKGYPGIFIVDISDKTNPELKKYHYTGDIALDISISGNYAYIADYDGGLEILDISEPEKPVLVKEFKESSDDFYFTGVEIQDNFAYLRNVRSRLLIVDISDPLSPELKGEYDTLNEYVSTLGSYFVSGNYAYTAEGDSGLCIIDISDPENPFKVSQYSPQDFQIGNIFIKEDYAYVSNAGFGVSIIDISIPENPYRAGYYLMESNNISLYLTSDYMYLLESDNTLHLMSRLSPRIPYQIGYYTGDILGRDILAASGDHIFLGSNLEGFCIIKNEYTVTSVSSNQEKHADSYILHDNYPNPFNPVTNIRFEIPAAGKVSVKIYNIRGQLIKSLISGQYPAGEHTVKWDGINDRGQRVSSGIYIYRLQTGNQTKMKKMLLIK